jgi:hypothetical protein
MLNETHTAVAPHTKEVNGMRRRSYSASYAQARSYKWIVGVIFILAALYMYFIAKTNLFEAATIFGIGVILV